MFGGSGGDGGSCACDLPANDNAYRLDVSQGAVTSGAWAWAVEKMPEGRNMVDSVSAAGVFFMIWRRCCCC